MTLWAWHRCLRFASIFCVVYSSRHYLLNCPGSFRLQSVVGSNHTPGSSCSPMFLALFASPLPCDVDVAIDTHTPQQLMLLGESRLPAVYSN